MGSIELALLEVSCTRIFNARFLFDKVK